MSFLVVLTLLSFDTIVGQGQPNANPKQDQRDMKMNEKYN